jgi:hypothetical protein
MSTPYLNLLNTCDFGKREKIVMYSGCTNDP